MRVRELYTGDSLLGLITNLLCARFITWGKNDVMDQNTEEEVDDCNENVIFLLVCSCDGKSNKD